MIRTWMLLALAAVSTAAADKEKAPPTARAVAEGYVAAVVAGKVEAAQALAVAGKSPATKERIEEFRDLLGAKAVKLDAVVASEKGKRALAHSAEVTLTKANPDGTDTGHVLLTLELAGRKWLVRDVDFRTKDAATERLKAFRQKHADAKDVPAKRK